GTEGHVRGGTSAGHRRPRQRPGAGGGDGRGRAFRGDHRDRPPRPRRPGAGRLGVTTEPVRRDLAVLERAGMLRRVHGGAVPAGLFTVAEPGLGERGGARTEQKRRIAAAALALVPGTKG